MEESREGEWRGELESGVTGGADSIEVECRGGIGIAYRYRSWPAASAIGKRDERVSTFSFQIQPILINSRCASAISHDAHTHSAHRRPTHVVSFVT